MMGRQSYPERPIVRVLAGAVVALGLRAAWVFGRYELRDAATHRYHVESATLIFLGVGLAFWWWRGGRRSESANAHAVGYRFWILFGAIALLLYWPALSVGFLSDDYVLGDAARRWTLVWGNPDFTRPLPFSLWAVLLNLGAGPIVLHAINIALHATNSYLTAVVSSR
jgi:hypothetical protein